MSAASQSPQFRFVSDNEFAVAYNAPLQMVRRVDAAGAFSWRAPKVQATMGDVQRFALEQGGDLKLESVSRYRGGYRFTLVVG